MDASDATSQITSRQDLRLAWPLQLLAASLILALIGCGGGGGGGGDNSQTQTTSTPDFSLALNPGNESISGGNSATVTLSATAIDGFSSPISIQITGLVGGVSVFPANITLTPGKPQQLNVSAAPNAPTTSQTLTFTGSSGSLSHTTQLNLSVTGTSSGLPTRTRYVRTDATTEYDQWINQNWILYHAATARYFVTDPSSNQVIVIDAASQTKIATLGVPGAFGINDTPDHSTLYVGTLFGDIYTIDPVGMAVTQRYEASQIGPYGFFAYTALVLANGKIALVGGPSSPNVGESLSVAIWNPTDNSLTNYGENGTHSSLPFPCSVFAGTIAGFTLSADRTQIIFGIGETLCEMNPLTGTGVNASGVPLGLFSLYHIVVTPDGKYVILASSLLTLQPSVAEVFNAQTLASVAQFNVLGTTSAAMGFFVSADSTTLYTPADPAAAIIYAYNLATQQLVGWVPNIFVQPTSGGEAFGPIDSPFLLATDGTGLFAGPMEEGIGFVDLSILQTGPVGTQFTSGYPNPATGSVSGGTVIQWSDEGPVGPLESIDFSSQPASAISGTSETSTFVNITATSPPSSAGPADVYVFTTDGGMQLLPEAFSYGPSILEVTPNMATVEGGGTGYIYGYGFGPVSATSIPSDLNVTVGGEPAQISAFIPNAYDLVYPPFQLQGIAYTIPPGVAGSMVNVTVSTNSGSATMSGALTYLSLISQIALTGSTLAQGIYDSYTGLYYFTDTNQVQVFSRTQGEWLSPISIPAPKGTTQRLWGIALSPDGNILAVSDANAGAIYVLNPANPTSVKTFIVGSQSPFIVNPCGLAVSDAGNVYYAVFVIGQGGGADQFFKLNTTTGAITNYLLDAPGLGNNDEYLRDAITSDNATVFYNEDGQIIEIDTATDTLSFATIDPACCYGNYELALSSDQTQLTGSFYIYDAGLNAESYYAENDREILNIAYVYGAKISADGRLLFQPSTNGIDVFDGERGNLLNRISLPFALSPNYDALVDDGTDNVLIAITGTGNGISIIDLTSLNEPTPLPNNHRPASGLQRSSKGTAPSKVSPLQRRRPIQPALAVRHVTRAILPNIK